MLDWVVSLQEIHGERSPPNNNRYPNNKAFRLYVKLNEAALEHIHEGDTFYRDFYNTCTEEYFPYDGSGSRHPDFCAPKRFDLQRKTDNYPNIQFNVSLNTGCADIDIDYRKGLAHMLRDNSNVLASGHTLRFLQEYCDPGFRVKG